MIRRKFAPRYQKALKIHSVISRFLHEDNLDQLWCLDLGCGSGEIARYFAKLLGKVVALDYLFEPLRQALNDSSGSPLPVFLQADGVRLPFCDSSFDIVICAQVYEHLECANDLPEEIERVLKPGGLCFFSGPNKLWPIEPHFGLPFLHWLPQNIASLYLRIFRQGREFSIRPLTYWRLRSLFGRFYIYDCTALLLSEPDRFGISVPIRPRFFREAAFFLARFLVFLLPNLNWVLLKNTDGKKDCN